jgi:vancomycin resistance protein YoaR
MPGVSVQGMPVGGMSRQEVSAALATRYDRFLRHPVRLSYNDQTWTPHLAALGVSFERERLAKQTLEPGRRGSPITRIRELWTLWNQGIDLAPRLTLDWQQLQTYLAEEVSSTLDYPPEDASLSVASGKVIGTPARDGLQTLIDETAHDVALALHHLTPRDITIRTRPLLPTLDNQALTRAEERAQSFLSPTLTLSHTTGTWQWDAEKLANLLKVEPREEAGALHIEIDPERLTREVERLAQVADSGSAEPRLHVEGGALHIVQEGQTGWRLRQHEAAHLISTTLHLSSGPTRTVALPMEEIRPRITPENLHTLGIVELVGEGKSSFAGSAAYRITNIKAGAARLDGVPIAPGEEFSFNTQLGEVNAEHGFVEGYAVIGNRTRLEWGGGVCQNSTTVFRAAFWAGLPITERHAHPFYISWYDRFAYGPHGNGPGMDATIFTGVSDLTFVNDTGNWLLMHAHVDEANQIFTVQLYGTNPGRQVLFDGPYISNEVRAPSTPVYINDPSKPAGTLYQSDVARSGRDIVIYRTIVENGVEVRQDSFFTRFKAWPNVFIRGTGR